MTTDERSVVCSEYRNRFLLDHFELVRKIANVFWRKCGGIHEFDELVNVGAIAVLECCDRYDPDKGDVSRFLSTRIYGEILTHCQRNDKLARGQRKLFKQHFDNDQNLGDTSDKNHITLMPFVNMVSLDHSFDDSGKRNDPGKEPETPRREQWEEACAILKHLPDRSRLIYLLYYYEDKTIAEIGKSIGLCKSRANHYLMQARKDIEKYLIENQIPYHPREKIEDGRLKRTKEKKLAPRNYSLSYLFKKKDRIKNEPNV